MTVRAKVALGASVVMAVALATAPASAEQAEQAEGRTVAKAPPALVVKVDNAPRARPHTGLSTADLIYVEPVEGGFTRLAAVFWGSRPPEIGPVRSARQTDIELLGYQQTPLLTYSGASSKLQPLLDAADLAHATPKTTAAAFYRIDTKPSPHNLYVHPRELPATKPVKPPLRTGPAPEGGLPMANLPVRFGAATYDFTWSRPAKRWLVTLDGSPLISSESGQLGAGTVVVQSVQIVDGEGIHDSTGAASPVARTVGSGDVTVLRDGRSYGGTWTRERAADQTTYRTSDGMPVPLGDGPVWVLLVPR